MKTHPDRATQKMPFVASMLVVLMLVFACSSQGQPVVEAASGSWFDQFKTKPMRELLGPEARVLQDTTKWPKVVPVRSPDPIYGDASHLDIWSYDKRFAQRFENFPIEQADPDMPKGLWAVALRVYEQSYAPAYTDEKLYSCQIDRRTGPVGISCCARSQIPLFAVFDT